MIQTLSRIQSYTTVEPITGETRTVAWFQQFRVIHKNFPDKREHTNEYCWCDPIVMPARAEDHAQDN